jgi:hypothetical protein
LYTTSPVSGRTSVVNNIKNVEAPQITNSTRVTGAPRVLSTRPGNGVTSSFLVTHYLTVVSTVTGVLPRVFSQVERVTISFRKQSGDYLIESLAIVKVQSEEVFFDILTK